MEERIVLDRKSFEALAVDSRIRILKSLKQRRKTLSEIAKEQDMSVSGVKEHLETLEKVGLIEKKDDGHKWKYYELTKKGSDIVAPHELRVWILLSMSAIALIASLMAVFYAPEAPAQAQLSIPESAMAPTSQDAGNQNAMVSASPEASEKALSAMEPLPKPDLSIPITVALISSITLLGCALILAKNRFRPASL